MTLIKHWRSPSVLLSQSHPFSVFSPTRHLDLSNNSLTALSRETLATAPQLETLVLQTNPWSCDCRMNWFLGWSQAHPGDWDIPPPPKFRLRHVQLFYSHFLCVPDNLILSEMQISD